GLSPAESGGEVQQGHRRPTGAEALVLRSHSPGVAWWPLGSGRMVGDRPGGPTGAGEDHDSRLAAARLGAVPALARLPGPVRVLGRRRRAGTARPVGADAAGMVVPSATGGIDHTQAPSVRIARPRGVIGQPECPETSGFLGVSGRCPRTPYIITLS